MRAYKNISPFQLLGIVLMLAVAFALGMIYQKVQGNKLTSENMTVHKKQADKNEDEGTIDYFKTDILPKYPNLASEISQVKIIKAQSFALKNENSQGWIIATQPSEDKRDIYLLTTGVQEKLEHPMTSGSGEDAVCHLTDIVFIGNERDLGRDLMDPNGYVVLSGRNCQTYGGGSFISLYQISNGEKISFSGNITTAAGNAQGRLRGIYGINQPTVVVDYGMLESAGNSIESVSRTAHFDLQTGRLKQIIEFK